MRRKPAHSDHRLLGKQGREMHPFPPPEPEINRDQGPLLPRPGASTPSARHLLHPALHSPGIPRNLWRSGSPRCQAASVRDGTKPTPEIWPQNSAAETSLTSTGAKMAERGRQAPPRGLVGCTLRPSRRLGRLHSARKQRSERGSTQSLLAQELYFFSPALSSL